MGILSGTKNGIRESALSVEEDLSVHRDLYYSANTNAPLRLYVLHVGLHIQLVTGVFSSHCEPPRCFKPEYTWMV